MLIYNGDADSCVPYVGNEEWTSGLAEVGVHYITLHYITWSGLAEVGTFQLYS